MEHAAASPRLSSYTSTSFSSFLKLCLFCRPGGDVAQLVQDLSSMHEVPHPQNRCDDVGVLLGHERLRRKDQKPQTVLSYTVISL